MQAPYDEGRANYIGPESRVSDREVWGEALTGEAMGLALSHVTKLVRDADAFCVEGDMEGCAIASAPAVPRGQRPRQVVDAFSPTSGSVSAQRRRTQPARGGSRPKSMALRWTRSRRRASRGHVFTHRHGQTERYRPTRLVGRRARSYRRSSCLAAVPVTPLEPAQPERQQRSRR